jgi:hypothetical protein
MGIRGFEWAVYEDDLGQRWLMKVDADYFADPDRGWSAPGESDTALWPQGWKPREVEGVESTGATQRTRVGALSANLWTRAVTSFAVNTSDQLVAAAQVFRYWGERRRPSPPNFP